MSLLHVQILRVLLSWSWACFLFLHVPVDSPFEDLLEGHIGMMTVGLVVLVISLFRKIVLSSQNEGVEAY